MQVNPRHDEGPGAILAGGVKSEQELMKEAANEASMEFEEI